MADGIMKIACILVSSLITIFTIGIIIIYSLNETFKSLPCYFNILFCVVNSLDNILRLIPPSLGVDLSKKVNKANFACKMQAISLSVLDKYLLSLMTIYSIIYYLGQFNNKFYQENTKALFVAFIFCGLIISLILSICYYFGGIIFLDEICYINGKNLFNKISDNIYTIVLFIINLFCLTKVILQMITLIKESIDNSNLVKELSSRKHLRRLIIDLIINIIAFIFIVLLINKLIPEGEYLDMLFVLLCLMVELFFTMNEQFYSVIIKIFKCQKNENMSYSDKESQFDYSIIDYSNDN